MGSGVQWRMQNTQLKTSTAGASVPLSTVSNIAVFIDFENFAAQQFKPKLLINKLKERGRLIVKRAYADWGRFANYKHKLLESSVELIELPSHGGRGKNSADIKLVVDALEVAITKDHIDTFVVASGDSDYTPLIAKLREYGKRVIVVGHRKSVSSLLSGFCDELVYYETLVGEKKVPVDNKELKGAYDLLLRVLAHLENEGVEARSSIVKNQMKQFDASFSEENYGFNQFRKFLAAAEKQQLISLADASSGNWLVSAYNEDQPLPPISQQPVGKNNGKSSGGPKNVEAVAGLVVHALDIAGSKSTNSCRFSVLISVVRKLDPEFSLPKYGYGKSKGAKQMIVDCETEGFLTYKHDPEINDLVVTATEKLAELREEIDRPASYQDVLYAHHLNTRQKLYWLTKNALSKVIDALQRAITTSDFPNVDDLKSKIASELAETGFTEEILENFIQLMMNSGSIRNPAGESVLQRTETVATVDDLEPCWGSVLRTILAAVYEQSQTELNLEETERYFQSLAMPPSNGSVEITTTTETSTSPPTT